MSSFKVNSFGIIQLQNQLLKKINCAFDKISLHSLTASRSEASFLSPTVQFDFSWTLEKSERQNDRFGRPSDTLKSSISTLCTS